ncbi:beta-carotene ketolase [Fulvimarina endophytica]|uniref:Beta-carotene ketolase n=1 Tax=Fulvimarina endophytica TaxID=2293836 RepID=A0A371X7T3_9HYPH|nr:fatty acid desaturase [Fulvimarina endophytica]RFC65309.1 beta-carotene ketolase [Fulvimarina endophytica]
MTTEIRDPAATSGAPERTLAARAPKIRPFQAAIGLTLCVCVISAWFAIHIAAVFFFEITASTLAFVPLITAVQCWLTVGLFIVAHDAMHGSLAPGRRRLNGAIGAFILFVYAGFAWRKVRDAHFSHHDAPGTEADPDFFADDPENFWPWFRTFFSRYFGLRSVLFVSTVVTTYLVVLGARVENVVLFYGMPSLLSSLQLFYFGTYRPHRHEEEGHFADAHNARSNEFGYLASLFTCFHFGYHHEHHIAPWTPWWALPHMRER